jgi:hypothetical protein
MARAVSVVAMLFAAAGWYACGSSLQTAELRAHPATGSNPIEVPYPPPPAKVELIPPRPRERSVWIDGEWSWIGRQWTWEPGAWVLPPGGGYYAPWIAYRAPSGKVLFTPGAWYEENGRPLPRPAVLASAQSTLENDPSADAGSDAR